MAVVLTQATATGVAASRGRGRGRGRRFVQMAGEKGGGSRTTCRPRKRATPIIAEPGRGTVTIKTPAVVHYEAVRGSTRQYQAVRVLALPVVRRVRGRPCAEGGCESGQASRMVWVVPNPEWVRDTGGPASLLVEPTAAAGPCAPCVLPCPLPRRLRHIARVLGRSAACPFLPRRAGEGTVSY